MRAIRSGTVPGSTPARSSGTSSVAQRTPRKSTHERHRQLGRGGVREGEEREQRWEDGPPDRGERAWTLSVAVRLARKRRARQRLVAGAGRVQARDVERDGAAGEGERLDLERRGPRRADARAQPGDRDVGAERALLGRVDAGGLEPGGDARLQRGQRAGRVVELDGEDAGAARREQQDRAERERRRRCAARRSAARSASTSDGGRGAEERERDVQRLGLDRAPDVGVGLRARRARRAPRPGDRAPRRAGAG